MENPESESMAWNCRGNGGAIHMLTDAPWVNRRYGMSVFLPIRKFDIGSFHLRIVNAGEHSYF